LLIAEHRTTLLAGLCDRVVVLDSGSIVADGPAEDVLADERLPDWGVAPPEHVTIERAMAAGAVAP
jgi:energy-coupling factor transporter ATP-binding protein EcfA2